MHIPENLIKFKTKTEWKQYLIQNSFSSKTDIYSLSIPRM